MTECTLLNVPLGNGDHMILALAAAAVLSGDPQLCPQHSGRFDALSAVLERRPTDATLYFWEAATWADCRQVAPALAALARVRELGDGFLPIAPAGFAAIWENAEFQKRRREFENALPRVGLEAAVAFRVTGKHLIPEGIAYDAKSKSLFIGSMIQPQILRVRQDEQASFAAASTDLDSILGLSVDVNARRLYAVSTNQVYPREQEPVRNRVLIFDLDQGTLIRTLSADAGQLNDVTVGAGNAYVTDSRTGAVYVGGPNDSSLRELLAPGTLFGANGIALSADERSLFVAHATGVAKLDRQTGVVVALANTTRETIAAIDGLYSHQETLIGVQNATNPGRVIQIGLDPEGSKVVSVKTLLSHHHPMLDEPTTGAVDGNHFLLLANSHIAAVDENGQIRTGAATRDPVVLRIQL
jgi:hypothetical protein